MQALTKNALTVLERRYLLRDKFGHLTETPEQLFLRVARAIAAPDKTYGQDARATEERFFSRMARLEFLPNSPTLMNAGRERGQLAACFVVPVGDSMDEIFDAVKWAAEIQVSGGGTGFSFSRLRPAGDRVSSTGGQASGPMLFMDVFNSATEAVRQGGTRRGANMGVLRVDHPDVLDFITAKLVSSRLTNFNLSVAVTSDFMLAVSRGDEYALCNPRTQEPVRRIDARRVMSMIANVAWRTGDPGMIFIDGINASHPTPNVGVIESTNPCGEQPLLPFESCVLGSINLARFFKDGIDWDGLRSAVWDGVHFLDNVIDANIYPLPQIEHMTRQNRKIGLGVMGFADLLIAANVAYDDSAALDLAEELGAFIERESLLASAKLAQERGEFANYAGSRWAQKGTSPLRNATTTTVAPTGTISMIAGCSSGIEPLYAVSYRRHVLDGKKLVEVHAGFEKMAKECGVWSDKLMAELAQHGSVRRLGQVPENVRRLFPTAYEVSPEQHLRMQAAFQRYTHAAVSKTVNLPATATPGDIKAIYQLAYELDCKGVTVYRDGCRGNQVLTTGDTPQTEPKVAQADCPECGQTLVGANSCMVCRACGWSRCQA